MPRRDGGSTHTLEILLVITIMFASVATVVPYMNGDAGASSLSRIDRLLTTKARDTLYAWDDIPMESDSSCAPSTRLEKLVFDGIKGDHAYWDQLVRSRFDAGFDVDLVLDNHDAILPLHGSGRVVGSTADIDWPRSDTYVMPIPGVNTVSGLERLRIDAPAIHYGKLARPAGEAVRYQIDYDDDVLISKRVTWGLTAMHRGDPESVVRRAGASVRLTGELGGELMVSIPAPDPSSPPAVTLRVPVAPSAAGELIPVGTIVNVSFPAGWHSGTWAPMSMGDWEDISPLHTKGDPLSMLARAKTDSSPVELALDVYAPTDAAAPFDVVTARVERGGFAESNMIVTYPVAQIDRGLPRLLVPTTPYGVRAGSTHLFGAAFSNGGGPLEISRFEISIPGGYDSVHNGGAGAPLFAGIETQGYPTSGWRLVDGKRVVWEASPDAVPPVAPIQVGASEATAFWVRLRMDPDAAKGTSIEPAGSEGPRVRLAFDNEFTTTGRSWSNSPGIASFLVPPESALDAGRTGDGYPWRASAVNAPVIDARSTDARASVRGEAAYEVGVGGADAVSMEAALANASLEVTTRRVPAGSLMTVRGDLTSLFALLSQSGITSTLTLELYSPPTLGCFPTASWSLETESMPAPAIRAGLLWGNGVTLPRALVATDEKVVHLLDETGAPTWTAGVDGTPVGLTLMPRGVGDTSVLASLESGKLVSLDGATGRVEWSATIGDGPTIARFDVASDRIYAAAGKSVARVTPEGDVEHQAELDGTMLDLILTTKGILVRTDARFTILDPGSFATLETLALPIKGLTWNEGRIVVVGLEDIRSFASDGSASVGAPVPLPERVLRATRGELTGDAVEDILAVLEDRSIVAIDGSTGAIAWLDSVSLHSTATGIFPLRTVGDSEGLIPAVDSCRPQEKPADYATAYTCGSGDDLASEVASLAAGRAWGVAGLKSGAFGAVAHRAALDERDRSLQGEHATALDLGPSLAGSTATLVGTNLGRVYLEDGAGEVEWSSTPSERAGEFSFHMVVPEGGFYGSHLLVARVRWGEGQEASLVDWFDVVAKDGREPERVGYRVALSIDERGGD